MRLHEPAGSVQVTVEGNELIELVLEDIPGAGYVWQLTATGPLQVREPGYQSPDAIANGPVGAGASRLWQITPTGIGHGVVSGERGQPWEPDEHDRHFTLAVEVVPAGHHAGDQPGPASSAGSSYQQ